MGEFLTALAVTALVVVIAASIGCWLIARRFVRANRVVPDRRLAGPVELAVVVADAGPPAPSPPARRASGDLCHGSFPAAAPGSRGLRSRSVPCSSPASPTSSSTRAAQLDDRLAAAAGLAGPWRGRVLVELGAAVSEVEASVSHLERVAITWRAEIDRAGTGSHSRLWTCAPGSVRSSRR